MKDCSFCANSGECRGGRVGVHVSTIVKTKNATDAANLWSKIDQIIPEYCSDYKLKEKYK